MNCSHKLEDRLNIFRDPNFKFDELTHTYTYLNPETQKPVQIFTSVTGFISNFKKKFDSDFWSKRKAQQLGISKDAVLKMWQDKGDTAVNLGSAVHKWIEDYYKGLNPPLPTDPILLERVQKFLYLHEMRLHKLRPVEQEFRLFSRKWNIAGTTDALFEINQDYLVGDWKTNEKFTTNDHPKGKYQRLLYPFEDLWDNSHSVYSIQLSLYRLILEEEAGFTTKDAFLVWIGPEEKPKVIKAVDLRDRLYTYLQKNNFSL